LNYPDEAELTRIISSTTGPEDAGIEPIFHASEAAERVEGLKRLVREVMALPRWRLRGAIGARDAAAELALRDGRSQGVHDEMSIAM